MVARPMIIGNYVVERELGRGGMGIVYAGSHRVLGHPAAIKVLHVDTIQHRDRVERFFNEARAAMTIEHPSVVKIYDVGIAADDRAYIVMELLAGSSLASRLRHGAMPIRTALDFARRITAALVAIHGAGIVHRDLKPDNIIVLDRDGGLKIVDFGIAKLATATNVRTATGALLGTPAYMSPEQCEGLRELDARSDLYALGCVIYAMLTGRPPFEGGGTGGVIASHMREPPPPLRTRCPGASPALEAIVQCMLAKSPNDRYASSRAALAAMSSPEVDVISAGADGVAATADGTAPTGSLPPPRASGYTATAGTGPMPYAPAVPLGPHAAHPHPHPLPPSLGYAPTAPDPRPSTNRSMPHAATAPDVAPPQHRSSRGRMIALLVGTSAVTAVVAILLMKSCAGSGAPGTTASTDAATIATTAPPADAATRAPTADAPPLSVLLPPIDAATDRGRDPKRSRPDARGSVAGLGTGSGEAPQPSPPDARSEPVATSPPDAAPAPEPPPKVRITDEFTFTKNDFSVRGQDAILDRIADAMDADPRLEAKITGYAISTEGGNRPENLAGSRANAVKMQLVNRGVHRDRISTSSRVADGSGHVAKIVVE